MVVAMLETGLQLINAFAVNFKTMSLPRSEPHEP